MDFNTSTRGTEKASYASIASVVKVPSLLPILLVCHFVSDSHEVMTLIVVLPLIVVVEIYLQLHRSSFPSNSFELQTPKTYHDTINFISETHNPILRKLGKFKILRK
jgi:hypothetical protein